MTMKNTVKAILIAIVQMVVIPLALLAAATLLSIIFLSIIFVICQFSILRALFLLLSAGCIVIIFILTLRNNKRRLDDGKKPNIFL